MAFNPWTTAILISKYPKAGTCFPTAPLVEDHKSEGKKRKEISYYMQVKQYCTVKWHGT
jgi:hypothetical protein